MYSSLCGWSSSCSPGFEWVLQWRDSWWATGKQLFFSRWILYLLQHLSQLWVSLHISGITPLLFQICFTFFFKHSLRRTYSLLFKSSGAVWIIIKKVFVCSLLSLPKQFLFNYKYSRNSNIVKWLQFQLFYYSILKCNIFRWWERYIFSSHYSNFHFWSI